MYRAGSLTFMPRSESCDLPIFCMIAIFFLEITISFYFLRVVHSVQVFMKPPVDVHTEKNLSLKQLSCRSRDENKSNKFIVSRNLSSFVHIE